MKVRYHSYTIKFSMRLTGVVFLFKVFVKSIMLDNVGNCFQSPWRHLGFSTPLPYWLHFIISNPSYCPPSHGLSPLSFFESGRRLPGDPAHEINPASPSISKLHFVPYGMLVTLQAVAHGTLGI